MKEVYVISWRYSDGSASGIVRAYATKDRAEEDMKLLEESYSCKQHELHTMPLYGSEPSS